MDFWLQRAKSLADEAAKKTQELTKEATKLSQGFASETAKRSREFAVEATKRADLIKAEAIKRADQIKTLTDGITPQIPSISLPASSASTPEPSDLEKYGVTDDLREFVKGLTVSTFRDFPIDDEPQALDVPTVSNVRQDLTEFQARHAMLVLSSVKEISHFRYELCPRHMKERSFWKIYFTLVKNHVAPYEKAAMNQAKLNLVEEKKDVRLQETQLGEVSSKLESPQPDQQQKKPTEDIDAFLLGDLGSSEDEPDVGGGAFDDDDDDDFDKIVSASSSKRP